MDAGGGCDRAASSDVSLTICPGSQRRNPCGPATCGGNLIDASGEVRLRAKALQRVNFRVIARARKLERATGIEPV